MLDLARVVHAAAVGIAPHIQRRHVALQGMAAHRQVFFRYTWMDYTTRRRGALRLLPAPEQRASWAQDYDAMRETMFFGNAPSFDDILRVVGEFEQRFNAAAIASS